MFFEDLVDLDAPNNYKIMRRTIVPAPFKSLKRSASTAELRFKQKDIRPFKRQALEEVSEDDESSSESLETIFAYLGLDDNKRENCEGESDLSEPFSGLNLQEAIILCPYSISSFLGVSFIDFYNEWSYNSYISMLPSYLAEAESPFNREAKEFFEAQPMVKHLIDVFAVPNITTLFLVCERSCPYTFNKAVERTLLLEPDWINPILSVMFQLCLIPGILEKTVLKLVETKAVEVDLEILGKVCISYNRRFSPEAFVRWIRDGVSTKTLTFLIAYSTVNESVLEAALANTRHPLLISLLAQKLSDIRPSLVMKALSREYPEGIINQLMGICSSPESIHAARKDSGLLKSMLIANDELDSQ